MRERFKKLDLLEYVLSNTRKIEKNTSSIAIISVQHIIETTGNLFDCFIRLGIPAENILLMGKLYSNNSKVAELIESFGIEVSKSSDGHTPGTYYELFKMDCQQLWCRMIEKIAGKNIATIIVLDDGGVLTSIVPESVLEKYCVIAVEQTTSGIELNKEGLVSIISVAGSAVKRFIEPSFISQAVIAKARKYLLNYNPACIGILGTGNIGMALVKDLSTKYPVTVYDIEKKDNLFEDSRVHIARSADELFQSCDFIIGATGKDVSKKDWIDNLKTDKVLISVSSGDIEFRTLLKSNNNYFIKPITSLLDDVSMTSDQGHTLSILRGGTPINFDNNIHSVLPEYIQITRALLLTGVIQAMENSKQLCRERVITKLDPVWQKKLLKEWLLMVDSSRFEFSILAKKIIDEPFFAEQQSLGN